MPDITIDSLTREQIAQLDKLFDVFGVEPSSVAETLPIIVVLEVARGWFLRKQQALRMEERGG